MAYNNIIDDKTVLKRQYIVDTIIDDIQVGNLVVGSVLPSLNELTKQFGVSYFTAVAAYQELMARGIIKSVPRKGYRVITAGNIVKHRVFLFLNDFISIKNVLYRGVRDGIGADGMVDVYFHHFNPKVYQQTIFDNLGHYTAYVVLPMYDKACDKALDSIPEGKLYILDVGLYPYGKKYPSVCQDMENELYATLLKLSDSFARYNKLVLLFENSPYLPNDYYNGFSRFCREQGVASEYMLTTEGRKVSRGECYLVLLDVELDALLTLICEAGLEPGTDVGIVSLRETPLKSHVFSGITTICPDFRKMGLTMADMILNQKKEQIEIPFDIIRRGSL